MDESTATGKLLVTLKQEFKAKGLHYRDVAARLNVSEGTVKRYFSGKGLSLHSLEQLAGMIDHDFLSLAALTAQRDTAPRGLTREQAAALRGNKVVLAVFCYLGLGLTPAQIAREFDLAQQIDRILIRLQSLGLIRRLSNNHVKLLAKPGMSGFSWEVDSEVRHRKVRYAREFLDDINLDDERSNWMDLSARLSADSIVNLREAIHRFANDVQSLTKRDLALPPDKTQWYRLFVGAEPVSRKRIFRSK
jgi:transcriptional regulator with XRE-family HTH domain